MPKKHDNIIRKQFLRSKTIKVIPSSITRIRPIIHMEDPKETPSIDHAHIENTEAEETTIADIATTGHPVGSNITSAINLDTS